MKALLAALFLAFGLLCPCAEAQQKAPLVPPPFDEAKNTEQPPAGSKVEYVKLPAQASKPSPDEGEDVTELFRKPLLTKPPNKVNLLDEFDPPTAEAARADAESRQRLVVWRWGGLALVPLALISLSAWGASILVKSGRIGRLLLALRAIPERLLTPRVVLVVACLLLIASWAYPPGFERESRHVSRGWFFLFDTDSDMQVDFPRLILLDAIIAAGAGMVAWSVSGSSSSRGTVVRLTFYLMVGVPVLAVAGGTALVCVWAFPQAEAWTNQPAAPAVRPQFDPTKPFEIVETPMASPYDALLEPPFDAKTAQPEPRTDHRAGIHVGTGVTILDAPPAPAGKYADLLEAAPPPPPGFVEEVSAGPVSAVHLKRITLSDVQASQTGRVVSRFRGRLRNGLSRAIDRVEIKVSILGPSGQVVEVRRYDARYWVHPEFRETYLPDEPAPFEINDTISNLPEGMTWKVEVVAAHAK